MTGKVTCAECGNQYYTDASGEVVFNGTCLFPECPMELCDFTQEGYFPLDFREDGVSERDYDVDFVGYYERVVDDELDD